ncbi:hypothetical protein J6590_094086 [Homalodisca vitripennis]|nr:hypothetical protein J6590_094086 [Homalodisca vitripennis]
MHFNPKGKQWLAEQIIRAIKEFDLDQLIASAERRQLSPRVRDLTTTLTLTRNQPIEDNTYTARRAEDHFQNMMTNKKITIYIRREDQMPPCGKVIVKPAYSSLNPAAISIFSNVQCERDKPRRFTSVGSHI